MARYRKVETGVWGDARFRAMTAAQPNGQTLWLYLLCGQRTTTFPGLVVAREAVIADDLGWSVEGFREAFREAFREGLVEADWKAGVVILRKALLDGAGDPRETSRPESPNVLKGWAKSWDEVPDCALKSEYLRLLGSFAEALGEAFTEAFRQGFRKALAKASPDPSPNQDQEQKQDQDQERESLSRTSVRAKEPVIADPETLARRLLAARGWADLNALRQTIAAELGQTALDLPAQGRDLLQMRLRDESDNAKATKQLDNALACLAIEARAKRTVKFLTAAAFEERSWRALCGMTPQDAADRYRGPSPTPAKRAAGVGRVEPHEPHEYPDGEVTR